MAGNHGEPIGRWEMSGLVKELRQHAKAAWLTLYRQHPCWKAADRIEALAADVVKVKALLPASAEPVAWMHPIGSIWRVDNCPAGIDFTKDGWIPLYASPPASGEVEAVGWQSPNEPDWRPIETAPRDGELIIIGSYNARNQWCCDIWNPLTLIQERKRIADGFYKNSPHLEWNPTHWTPLPTPPAAPTEGR